MACLMLHHANLTRLDADLRKVESAAKVELRVAGKAGPEIM